MDINHKNVTWLWKTAESVFNYTQDLLDLFPETEEIKKFKRAYYDYMNACNKLHDYAQTLPF